MKNTLLALLATLLVATSFTAFAKDSFVLVTPEEAAREQLIDFVDKAARSSAVEGAPKIQLLSPIIDSGPVKAPINIELVFEISDGATLDRESIRMYYGYWKVDVTKRMLGEAEFTDVGLLAENADVPEGKHKLLVVVQDSKKRQNSKLFNFKVKN